MEKELLGSARSLARKGGSSRKKEAAFLFGHIRCSKAASGPFDWLRAGFGSAG
jgi:hypothetical protein